MSPEPPHSGSPARSAAEPSNPPWPPDPDNEDLTREDATELARSLKALADPIRLRLVSLIGSHPDGTVSVFELAQAFHVTGPTLSHHLRVLREAGLVSADRRGTWVYYALVPEQLADISGVLGTTFPVDPDDEPCDRVGPVAGPTRSR